MAATGASLGDLRTWTHHVLYVNFWTSISAFSVHYYFQVGTPILPPQEAMLWTSGVQDWMSVSTEMRRMWKTCCQCTVTNTVSAWIAFSKTMNILTPVSQYPDSYTKWHRPNTSQNPHHLLRFVLYTETLNLLATDFFSNFSTPCI